MTMTNKTVRTIRNWSGALALTLFLVSCALFPLAILYSSLDHLIGTACVWLFSISVLLCIPFCISFFIGDLDD